MIHYTCDLCGRSIGKQHFVAKIEVAPTFDPDDLTEDDLDIDHLEQIADIIAETGTTGDDDFEELTPKQFKFELCSQCCQQYLKAPLGKVRTATRLKYSQN
ncbi:hypothetical protein SH668x_002265 [Planctomicrobium sp. SH668]|uniref:hypothetical protein n=1 Tax=Planctomicrobium sp. SH668 TaxID=3448126 RepID=UPI003F5C7B8F